MEVRSISVTCCGLSSGSSDHFHTLYYFIQFPEDDNVAYVVSQSMIQVLQLCFHGLLSFVKVIWI